MSYDPDQHTPPTPAETMPAVGDLFVAKRRTAVCDPGEVGVCYEVYARGTDTDPDTGKRIPGGTGASVIFERGRYDGFSPKDRALMLIPLRRNCLALRDYSFTHVVTLATDYANGRFAAAFQQGRSIIAADLAQVRRLTARG